MRDNKTSQSAQEYDANIEKTIPLYSLLHEQTIGLIESYQPHTKSWLDTGCGTGILIEKAAKHFAGTQFTLADPSNAMLDIAQAKLSTDQERCSFLASGTENIKLPPNSFDVITAILAHHYASPEARQEITKKCYSLLKPGGMYITFESIRPATETGLQIGLERWRQAQLKSGKSVDAVTKHIARYGIEFLPITIAMHLDVLRDSGFSTAELFWASYMQAGFYAIK